MTALLELVITENLNLLRKYKRKYKKVLTGADMWLICILGRWFIN